MAETLRQRIEQMRNEALEKSTADWVLDLNYALEAPDDDGDRYDVLALTDQLVFERGRYDDLFREVNSYRAQLPRDAKLRAFADSMTQRLPQNDDGWQGRSQPVVPPEDDGA